MAEFMPNAQKSAGYLKSNQNIEKIAGDDKVGDVAEGRYVWKIDRGQGVIIL